MNPRDAKLLAWIVQEVCALGGVTRAEMVRSESRGNSHVAFCRSAAMALAREFTDAGTSQIGEFFNREHTTVSHAVKLVQSVLSSPERLSRARAQLYLQMHGRVQRRIGVNP